LSFYGHVVLREGKYDDFNDEGSVPMHSNNYRSTIPAFF